MDDEFIIKGPQSHRRIIVGSSSPLQRPGLLSRRAQVFWGFDKVTEWTSNIPKIGKIGFASCFLDTLGILKILGILGWHPQAVCILSIL